jgi:hypothetical protein
MESLNRKIAALSEGDSPQVSVRKIKQVLREVAFLLATSEVIAEGARQDWRENTTQQFYADIEAEHVEKSKGDVLVRNEGDTHARYTKKAASAAPAAMDRRSAAAASKGKAPQQAATPGKTRSRKWPRRAAPPRPQQVLSPSLIQIMNGTHPSFHKA